MVCGDPLVLVEKEWMSYWRHVNTPPGTDKHRPVALREYEEDEKRSKERYCYSEHPVFLMLFCRLKPHHEGKHRSRGGFEWERMVSSETKRCGAMKEATAKVTCLTCLWTWEKTCSLGYKAEKEFYLKYKPTCSRCGGRKWKIEEILEVRPLLNESEKDLFSLQNGTRNKEVNQ